MSYITRIPLDFRKRKTMRAMVQPSIFHGIVENCFELGNPRKRHLWRLDSSRRDSYILIVSKEKPNIESAVKQIGFQRGSAVKNYDEFLRSIKDGATYRFRLRANPVRKPKVDGKTQIIPLISEEAQLNWLNRQSKNHGFAVLPNKIKIIEDETTCFTKKTKERTRTPITMKCVTYDGVLTVTDADTLRKTLMDGMGRERAFGCGLLTLAPIAIL